MRLAIAPLILICAGGCGPDLDRADRVFEERLAGVLSQREVGPIPPVESRAVLDQLFDEQLTHVCVVYGGDWTPGVDYQWSNAETPPPVGVEALRNLGSGQVHYDGMAAIVGVGKDGLGHVRRGWFGDGICSDHSGGPYCFPVEALAFEVAEGEMLDRGPFEGRRPKRLILIDVTTAQRSCPIEPDLR